MRRLLPSMLVLLTACSPQTMNEKLSTPQERATAVRVIEMIRVGNTPALQAMADDQLRPKITPQIVMQVAAMTPMKGNPELQTVGVNTVTASGVTRTFKVFNYELGADRRWAIAQILLDTSNGLAKVDGFYVTPTAVQASAANNFVFWGKSPRHYLWLAGMALAIGISLGGAIIALRSPRFRKMRWLWIIGSLVSFVTFSLNWTTGDFGIMPISVMLLGAAGLRAGPLAPWVFSFAIPVIAIVILMRALMAGPVDDEPDLEALFSPEE